MGGAIFIYVFCNANEAVNRWLLKINYRIDVALESEWIASIAIDYGVSGVYIAFSIEHSQKLLIILLKISHILIGLLLAISWVINKKGQVALKDLLHLKGHRHYSLTVFRPKLPPQFKYIYAMSYMYLSLGEE